MKRSALNESTLFNSDVGSAPTHIFLNNTNVKISVEECVERIRRRKGFVAVASAVPLHHVCSGPFCHPETDGKSDVYLCDYGVVHVCGENYCTLASPTPQGEYVCPISGLVLGVEHNIAYQKEGEEASFRIVKDVKRHKVSADEKLMTRARAIIEKLFYSATRQRLNQKAEAQRDERCKNLVERYTLQQQRRLEFVNLQEVLRIKSNVLSEPLPYKILQEDAEWVNGKCLHVIKQLWQKLNTYFYCDGKLYEQVKEAPVRLNAVYTALALIYMMKTGHRANDKVFVPYDPYVAEHVPREKDIPLFGFQVARMKKSKDLLISFFEKSIELNMYIRVDTVEDDVAAVGRQHHPPQVLFKPTAQGYYCKQCERRYYDGNKCAHMSL